MSMDRHQREVEAAFRQGKQVPKFWQNTILLIGELEMWKEIFWQLTIDDYIPGEESRGVSTLEENDSLSDYNRDGYQTMSDTGRLIGPAQSYEAHGIYHFSARDMKRFKNGQDIPNLKDRLVAVDFYDEDDEIYTVTRRKYKIRGARPVQTSIVKNKKGLVILGIHRKCQ
jgi:hypothetical protein